MTTSDIPDLPTEITPQSQDFGRWYLDVVRRAFVPNHALAAASEADAPALGKLIPFIADKTAVDGRPTAYVCVHGRCDLPVHEPDALAALLKRRLPYPPG